MCEGVYAAAAGREALQEALQESALCVHAACCVLCACCVHAACILRACGVLCACGVHAVCCTSREHPKQNTKPHEHVISGRPRSRTLITRSHLRHVSGMCQGCVRDVRRCGVREGGVPMSVRSYLFGNNQNFRPNRGVLEAPGIVLVNPSGKNQNVRPV